MKNKNTILKYVEILSKLIEKPKGLTKSQYRMAMYDYVDTMVSNDNEEILKGHISSLKN